MMKAERMIEILAEELIRIALYSSDDSIEDVKQYLLSEGKTDWEAAALTAMKRAVDEETKELNSTISALNRFRIEDAGSALDDQNRLRTELENERIRHAACGVLAMSNTPETLAKNREMNAEYLSASVQDVIRCVEENISLRAELERLKQCEAIVRELAQMSILDGDSEFVMLKYHARQWVRENPE